MKKLIDYFFNLHFLKHSSIVFGFGVFSVFFFYPVISGKKLIQSDIQQYTGMARQAQEFREKNNEEIYWIDNAFGGMPTYQLGARYPYDFLTPIHKVFQLIPQPAEILFLYLFSAYIFLLIINMPIPIAVFGAFAYALSTYLLIILQVGHNTKAQALAYMPLVIGGMFMLLNKNTFKGFVLTVIALALQIRANHYQMTYYMLLLMLVMAIVYTIHAVRTKTLGVFSRRILVLVIAGIFALGLNAPPLLATAEYTQFSTRGKSELTLHPDGSKKEKSTGLSSVYITQFSYGIFESFNLIAPRIQGGGSSENIGEQSDLYQFLLQNGLQRSQAKRFVANVPTYWGSQPILEAPAYVGVTVVFLAFLALFLVKGRLRNTLFIGIVLSLVLSWGKNLSFVTDFFINYFPLYNKFRAVSSIQIILEFCFPVLACLGIYQLSQKPSRNSKKYLLKSALGFISVLLILFFLKGFLSFSGNIDLYLKEVYGPVLMDEIVATRKSIFNQDLLRAGLFCSLITVLTYFFIEKKVSKTIFISALFLLMITDLLGVSQRYVDRELFVTPQQKSNLFKAQSGDQFILKDTSRFRVYEPGLKLSGARTSFFHNAIGGYHGAKPRRFEELYEYFSIHQISGVMDMLNVKYLLVQEEDQQKVIENPNVLGAAWAIDSLIEAPNVDAVLSSMKTLDFSKNGVVLRSEFPNPGGVKFNSDQLTHLELVKNHPTQLVYSFEAKEEQLVVFSEMYYPNGWRAMIDGEKTSIFPINYILRGLKIPAGNHTIEFVFDPPVVKLGGTIRLITLFLFIGMVISFFIRRQYKPESEN